MESQDSVIVVGTRPTLPHHQVEMEDNENSLRCRSSQGSSPEMEVLWTTHGGPTASTPAQGQVMDGGEKRSTPNFGTPGSLSDLCPDQFYLPPLDVQDTTYATPSPNIKLKMDQYQEDSGYGQGSDRGSTKSSLFDPFPNPEGSYVSNSSIWEMFSPVDDLKKKWRGRPSYLEDSKTGSMMDKFSVEPQQLLGCVMLIVISASVGFAFVLSFKHLGGENTEGMNSKYKSIEYGNQKLVERLRKEGRMIDEVRDEEGNLLGGKKAAIQFSFQQGFISEDVVEVQAKVDALEAEVEDKVGEEFVAAASYEKLVEEDKSGLAKRILEAAGELKTNDAQVKSLEDQIEELEKQKQLKLELIQKVKMFVGSKGIAPQPRKFGMEEENELVEEPLGMDLSKKDKPKKSKSHANPLFKSAPKPKISKAKIPAKSSIVIRHVESRLLP